MFAVFLLIPAGIAADEASHELLRTWGSTGNAEGQFDAPYHIALDGQQNLYVTDSENSRIQKFDQDGNFLIAWGKLGSEDGDFNIPAGVTVAGDRVYIGDSDNHQIQIFDLWGNFKGRFGEFGTDLPGRFWFPVGVAVDGDGYLYVADSWNNRIQKFALTWSNGNLLKATPLKVFGGPGSQPGSFDLPTGIAIDDEGKVVVCDTKNHRLQIIDPSLEGTPAILGREGSRPGQLNLPYAVDVGPDGNYYICDSGNDRIQVFNPGGTVLVTWGTEGTEPGQMDLPWGIEVGNDGSVFVADANNDRMEKFAPVAVPVEPVSWGRMKTAFVPRP